MPKSNSRSASLLLLLLAVAPAASAEADARRIVERAVETDNRNDVKAREFTYVGKTTIRDLDSRGQVKSVESEAKEYLFLYGRLVERTVSKNGKPLTPGEAEKERRRIEKLTEEWSRESASSRQRQMRKLEEERQNLRRIIGEIPKAFTFQLVGEEVMGGRRTWLVDAEPRADYRTGVPRADILNKFRGRLWIDQESYQLVRIESETTKAVSFGWFLARLEKGARIHFQMVQVDEDTWLPKAFAIRFHAKLGLLKSYRKDIEQENSDFRRFSTESRVVEVKASGNP